MIDRPELVDEWLRKAHDEELFARSLLKHRDAPAWGVGVMSHQSTEKNLKAFLVAGGRRYPRVHDIGDLLKRCGKIDNNLLDLLDLVPVLNSFYWESRYSGDEIEANWNDVEEAFEAAMKIKESVGLAIEKLR